MEKHLVLIFSDQETALTNVVKNTYSFAHQHICAWRICRNSSNRFKYLSEGNTLDKRIYSKVVNLSFEKDKSKFEIYVKEIQEHSYVVQSLDYFTKQSDKKHKFAICY